MKKRIGSIGVLFTFVIILGFFSGLVTYTIFKDRYVDQEALKTQQAAVDEHTKMKQNNDMDSMEEVLKDIKEVYLESYHGPSDIIQIHDDDMKNIVAHLKSLYMKEVLKSEYKDIPYIYAVHVKEKNVIIKVNEQYLIIDNLQGKKMLFEVVPEQFDKLSSLIENIYMKRYAESDIFRNPEEIYIEARDGEKAWQLDEQQKQMFLEKLQLLAPISESEVAQIVPQYPDYYITFKGKDKDCYINLINEEILTVDNQQYFSYFRYDSTLWEYMQKYFPMEVSSEDEPLTHLFKASKLIVDDMSNLFDLEDDSFYTVMLPRSLAKAKLRKTTVLPEDEALSWRLRFTVEGKEKEVKVYENYLEYEGQIYHSNKIAEVVRSVFAVQ
ncbi:MAG: hypothetical protein ACOYVK_05830 [Bacillota bacterium]